MLLSTVYWWWVIPDLGKGLHSEGGRAKIRPALENLCDEYVKILNRRILYAHLDRSVVGIHTLWFLGMGEYLLFSVDVADLGLRCYLLRRHHSI